MFLRVVAVAAVTAWAGPALAQSSAAFPDLPQRRSAPAPVAPAPAARPDAGETQPREPFVASPAFQSPTGSGYAPSFGASPAFSPTFAPSSPTQDSPERETATSGGSSTLLVVGALVLGLPYATGLGIGASESFDNGSGWLAAPVLGPWASLSARRDPCAESQQKQEFDSDVGKCVAEPLVRGMLVLDGVLQATGAVLMLVGASSGGPDKPRREPPSVLAAPAPMGRSGYGLAVAGMF